jgi:hypothetical protein
MGTFAELQSLITDYRFPTKDNKRPFSVSVSSKQTEVCRCRVPFAENKRRLPFFISSVFRFRNYGMLRHGGMEMDTWRHGIMEMETWKHGGTDMENWKHGDMETYSRDIET